MIRAATVKTRQRGMVMPSREKSRLVRVVWRPRPLLPTFAGA